MAAPPQPSLANKITPPGGSDGWDINFNDLENLQDLSSGNFGKVYRGTYFGTEVAVKKLLDIEDEFMHKYIEREMAILKSLRHPNIVQFMGLSKHSSGLYIITEFIAGGDMRHLLKDEAKDLSWKARVKMALDTAQAITYLHSKGCIHRDLKSHNLLVDENQKIKVCDFGFSRQVTGNKDEPMTLCGTDEWMAPEVMLGEKYDAKADVFSFGMVLWELITRQKPPKRQPGNKFAVDHALLRSIAPKNTPPDLLQTCIDCTIWETDKRAQVKDALEKLKNLYASLPDDPPAAAPTTAPGAPISKGGMTYMSTAVEVVEDHPAPAAQTSAAANVTQSSVPVKQNSGNAVAPAKKKRVPKEDDLSHNARAVKDRTGADDEELTFKKGDKIHVTAVDEEGWARGECNGKVGWFPPEFVESLEDRSAKRQSTNDNLHNKDKGDKDKGCLVM